jgi:hypothetical protein
LDSDENLITLSDQDHLQAHALLYEVYNNPEDRGACLLLQGQMDGAVKVWRTLGAEATHKIQKAKGGTVYDPEWQKEMATRSMARPDALEIRSKGGQVGGRVRNQDLVIKADDCYLFSYNGEEVLVIVNCRTGGEVLEQLNLYQPTKLERVTPLLKAERKSLHGWSCVKINDWPGEAISSQETDGL